MNQIAPVFRYPLTRQDNTDAKNSTNFTAVANDYKRALSQFY